jgi:hypothetical protein
MFGMVALPFILLYLFPSTCVLGGYLSYPPLTSRGEITGFISIALLVEVIVTFLGRHAIKEREAIC